MKTIRKITNKVTDNFSALAGSALLVGATLTGGAALASAQSGSSGNSMDLGEYPQPFVTEDGEVQTSIVLGSDAQVTDVVGATEIAGSLGAAAFGEDSVSTGSSGAGASWTAAEGVTLDTSNDNLYYGDDISAVRETLTGSDLGVLEETTFTDDNNDETDVTNYLNVGDKEVVFGNTPDGIDDDEDPVLHVPVDAEGEVGSDSSAHLFNLQANFGESIDFTDEDVVGETIELFGTEYTIADENEFEGDDSSNNDREELLLYGSQQDVDVNSGESTTITVNEEEVTLEVVSVNEGSTGSSGAGNAAVRVDGTLESVESGDTINVNDEEVRIDEIIKTGGSDSSSGVVNFEVGSQELTLSNGEQIQDSDDDDIEGSYVEFDGGETDEIKDISSIDLYVGAEDDEEDYVAAGETFSHSALPGVEFQFGGLSPDAADSDSATEVSVETNGDTEAQISFTTDGGETVTQDFIHMPDESGVDDDLTNTNNLADSDNDRIVTQEADEVFEDEYFTADAGDFSHMFEVTSIDVDGDDTTVEITDVATGNTIELEADEPAVDNHEDGDYTGDEESDYFGTEIIDGQKYVFKVDADDNNDGNTEPALQIAWGDGATLDPDEDGYYEGVVNTGGNHGGETSLFTALDTQNNGALAFVDEVSFDADFSAGDPEVYELPSTESTDARTVKVGTDLGGTTNGEVDIDVGNDGTVEVDGASTSDNVEVTVGEVRYDFEFDSDKTLDRVSLDGDQSSDDTAYDSPSAPAAVFMQPENEDDAENAFVLQPNDYDSDDGYSFSGSSARAYTGDNINVQPLEGTDEDTDAGYNEYGTYVEQDTEDEGSVSVMMPAGQSTVGAAFTGADGSLSASAGGSGSVMASMPTYEYADGVLADDGNVGQVKNNDNIIVVGGPAANSLTQELVEENQTMPAGDYTEGQGMIQMVDGWSEGNSALVVAGYSGEDTRTAAEFLADYRNNQDALEGNSEVTIETSSGSVVN